MSTLYYKTVKIQFAAVFLFHITLSTGSICKGKKFGYILLLFTLKKSMFGLFPQSEIKVVVCNAQFS